ncbi:MAG: hypothetical protein RL472_476, partial [Pseudomonadota bacterium]
GLLLGLFFITVGAGIDFALALMAEIAGEDHTRPQPS